MSSTDVEDIQREIQLLRNTADLNTLRREVRDLLNEVDCRIEHGAESGGHLEYVRSRLKAMMT